MNYRVRNLFGILAVQNQKHTAPICAGDDGLLVKAKGIVIAGPTKPLLRWAGSKSKLVPNLSKYWLEKRHSRYVEPFAGSASLFFSVCPEFALLSDINADLIETYIAVRDHPRAVHNRLTRLKKCKQAYYRIRSQDTERMGALDRAARFIYLNRFCFNGIYRTNLAGHFNVPYAPTKTGSIPDWDSFFATAKTLKRAIIVASDFESITRNMIKKHDFVYLDPPYAVANRRIFRQYGPNTFGLDDIDRFKRALHRINDLGASFVASYALSPESRHVFDDWHTQRIATTRNVSGFSKHRRKAIEVIATNIHN